MAKFPPFAITCKPGKIYLHLKDLEQNQVKLTGILSRVKNAYCLADNSKQALQFYQKTENLSITIPEDLWQPRVTVVVLEIADKEAKVIDETLQQEKDGLMSSAPSITGLSVYIQPSSLLDGRRRSFVVGGDPAEGNPTSDDSALTVLDVTSGEEAASLAKLEAQKEIDVLLKKERDNAKKEIVSETELKIKEYEKQLADQKKLMEEMKRKHEQGSVQLQGEVQELAIEEWLQSKYKLDTISNLESNLANDKCLNLNTFLSLCCIENINIVFKL